MLKNVLNFTSLRGKKGPENVYNHGDNWGTRQHYFRTILEHYSNNIAYGSPLYDVEF